MITPIRSGGSRPNTTAAGDPASPSPRSTATLAWTVARSGGRRRDHRQQRSGDRGSGTILVLVVLMVLMAAGGTAALVGAAIGVRHRAEAAADLAALAGAAALQRSEPSPCAVARRIASVNGAVMASCRIDGSRVAVTATLHARGPLARLPPAHARANAGPWTAGR